MKPLFLILLLSIIIFSHCDSQLPIVGKKKENSSLFDKIFGNCFALEFGNQHYKSNRIQDNRDGTISLVEVTAGSTCQILGLGNRDTIKAIYYIKKCIQGQVYRSTQNDCKGTGTAENYWGAQKFQFCSENGKCDETTSPAYLACSNDNNLNRAFILNNLSNSQNAILIYNYFATRPDEIPNDFFWLSGLEKINFYIQKLTITYQQTEYNYVLCS